MNKNIDLTELLKDCPKGTKFYSRSIGTVTFDSIKSDRICVKNHKGIETAYAKVVSIIMQKKTRKLICYHQKTSVIGQNGIDLLLMVILSCMMTTNLLYLKNI